MGKHHKRHSTPTVFESGFAIREIRPGYWLADFMVEGVRTRKAFDLLEDAKRFCRNRASEIRTEGTRSLSVPEKIRAEALAAMKLLAGTGGTIMDAVTEYVRRHPATAGELVKVTCEKYLAAMRTEGRRPLSVYEKTLKFKSLCESMGDIPTVAMDDADIEQWAKDREVGKLTTDAYISAARDLMLFYRRGGKLKPRHHGDEKPPVTWDVKTVNGLLMKAETLAPEIVPAFAILFFAGLRPHEMFRLTWEQVDVEANIIRLTGEQTKTRNQRQVEIQPNLLAWLKAYRSAGPVAPATSRYRDQRVAVMKACSLPDWPTDVARHTFATAHYNAFQDATRTMAQLGHFGSPATFLRHYKGVPMSAADAAAYWKIAPAKEKAVRKVVPFLQAAG